MEVKGLVWLGTRTSNFDAMVNLSTEVIEDGYAWAHFRAPDGLLYELPYGPKHPTC